MPEQPRIYNVPREFTFFFSRGIVRLIRGCLIVFLLVFFVAMSTVMAHTGDVWLLHSDPSINAVLAQSPGVIRLWFEDPLMGEFSRFQLRDINTRLIETPLSQLNPDDPSELFIPLETELPDGLYTITYQVISAIDGHEGAGSFAFIVGQVSDTAGQVLTYSENVSVINAGVRGLHGLALMIILGGSLFAALNSEASHRVSQVLWMGWIVYGLAHLAILWLQQTTLAVPDAGSFSGLLLRYLTSTRFGLIWCITLGVWLLMAVVVVRQPRAGAIIGFGVILAGLASISSRVTAPPEMYAAVAVYWLHIVSSGLWLGSLLFITFNQMGSQHVNAGIWQKFRRFSAIALPLIALTGLYNSWLRADTLEGLTSTAHGQALILKALLVVGLVMTFVYLVRQQLPGSISQRFQILLGLAVLTITGVIVTLTPGREIIALRNAIPPVLEYETTIQELLTVDGLHLQLYVTPGVAGINRLDVLVFESTTGTRLNDVSLLTLDLIPSEGETYQVQATFEGDGLYTGEDVKMSVIGRWAVRMTVTRPSHQDVIAPFTLDITEAVLSTSPVLDLTSSASERLTITAVAGMLHIIVGGLVLFLSGITPRPLSLRTSTLVISLCVVVLIGLFIHAAIYIICGIAVMAWVGIVAGSAGRSAYNTGNWDVILAMVSVSVGAILLINAGVIPFIVP